MAVADERCKDADDVGLHVLGCRFDVAKDNEGLFEVNCELCNATTVTSSRGCNGPGPESRI